MHAFKYRPLPQPTSHTSDPASRPAKNWATRGLIGPTGSSQFSYTSCTYARSNAADLPLVSVRVRSLLAKGKVVVVMPLTVSDNCDCAGANDVNDDVVIDDEVVGIGVAVVVVDDATSVDDTIGAAADDDVVLFGVCNEYNVISVSSEIKKKKK